MKCFLYLFLTIFCFFNLKAQERYVLPVDEARKDKSFFAFRSRLVEAAKKRNAEFVLSVVDRDIKNSFGGNDGISEFKKFWKINNPTSKFWNEFIPVITSGGSFINEGGNKIFFAPYSFNSFPENLDAFTHGVIFGKNVSLRARAAANSRLVANLSYNVVEIVKSVQDTKNRETVSWYEIKTLGGKKGFVKAEFVRSPIDYRAGFEKINGKWKMTIFLAGD